MLPALTILALGGLALFLTARRANLFDDTSDEGADVDRMIDHCGIVVVNDADFPAGRSSPFHDHGDTK